MPNGKMIIGLDIGAFQISAALCELDEVQGVKLRGVGTAPTEGISKGQILDSDALKNAIGMAISRCEQSTGIVAEDVMVNVPLCGIDFVKNMGVYRSRHQSGIIQLSDRNECVRRSSNIVKESYQRIVHVIPFSYRLDGETIENPVGEEGEDLEVESQIILGDSDAILDVKGCLSSLNLRMCGMVYDALASSQLFLTSALMQSGVYLLDIGHDVSKFSFFQKGVLVSSQLIPIGGALFTSDVAKIMKVSIEEAERLKVLYGDLNQKTLEKLGDQVMVGQSDQKVSLKLLNQI